MSIYLTEKLKNLTPYTPGEQPKDFSYVKLNTNESPFPPSKKAVKYASKYAKLLNLYPDPECYKLRKLLAEKIGVCEDELIITNGSDEILNFAFMAYCDDCHPVAFPNITYGFYKVFADLYGIAKDEIPLKDNFEIDINNYIGINKTIFIANPNAPTGLILSTDKIEEIIKSNPNNVVIVDEAYIDFGGESCIPLIHKYNNLLVTQTFSKSRSMAGARVGFGVGCKELIKDLNTIRYSTNPYNINSMSMAAAIGMLEDDKYSKKNCETIIKNRAYTSSYLEKLGFTVTDSYANFVFAKHEKFSGEEIYLKLKEKGVLVRHFNKPEISDYNRITIGTKKQMDKLITSLKEILEENIWEFQN